MRQFFLYTVIGLSIFVCSFHPLLAQEETKLIVVNRADSFNSISALDYNETVLTKFIEGVTTKDLTTATVTNEKLLRFFIAKFTNSTNTVWYTYGNKNKYFLARFSMDNRDYAALYHKNGSLEYALSKGSENDLPEQAKKNIRKSYSGYSVKCAIEIITEKNSSWSIQLQNHKEVVVIRTEGSWFEELAHYELPGKYQGPSVAKNN